MDQRRLEVRIIQSTTIHCLNPAKPQQTTKPAWSAANSTRISKSSRLYELAPKWQELQYLAPRWATITSRCEQLHNHSSRVQPSPEASWPRWSRRRIRQLVIRKWMLHRSRTVSFKKHLSPERPLIQHLSNQKTPSSPLAVESYQRRSTTLRHSKSPMSFSRIKSSDLKEKVQEVSDGKTYISNKMIDEWNRTYNWTKIINRYKVILWLIYFKITSNYFKLSQIITHYNIL